MTRDSSGAVTRLLADLSGGDKDAVDKLLPMVYDELRALAGRYARGERRDHTLPPTALVHEAYLRLVDQTQVQWRDRAHFFAVAATAIRRLLVDYARSHDAAKRGGEFAKVPLEQLDLVSADPDLDVVALHDAMERLAAFDVRKSRTVELRFFGGLSIEETAEVLGVSHATVERDWSLARAWLYRAIEGSQGDAP